jgi:hypothetical protein
VEVKFIMQMTDRSEPKMAPNSLAPTLEVQRWFDYALRATDPKPSLAECERLARQLQIIANQQNNAGLERHDSIPLRLLKDVSPAEEMGKRIGNFMSLANQLLFAARELEDYAGGYQWMHENGSTSLADIEHILVRIGAAPVAQTSSPAPARGRPREIWHAAALKTAPLISAAMRCVGYQRRLNMTDEESVTAKVGAKAISWAFAIELEPAGFATAMRMRDRRKRHNRISFLERYRNFLERYPDAARIQIL